MIAVSKFTLPRPFRDGAVLIVATLLLTACEATANSFNDKLLSKSSAEQAEVLLLAMQNTKTACKSVTRHMFQGLDAETAFWSIECDKVATWVVSIEPDSKSYVATCEKMAELNAPCWRSLQQ